MPERQLSPQKVGRITSRFHNGRMEIPIIDPALLRKHVETNLVINSISKSDLIGEMEPKDTPITSQTIMGYVTEHLAPPEEAREMFYSIWNTLLEEMDLKGLNYDLDTDLKDLIIYDILDGTRTTISDDALIPNTLDGGLFALGLIHYLRSLGVRSCVFMVATQYNRERGPIEFFDVIKKIRDSIPMLISYCKEAGVVSHVIRGQKDFRVDRYISELENAVTEGDFHAYFLLDYSEEWAINGGKEQISKLPNIDIGIRHTKFQPYGGGYIPMKMTRSNFLYCQNGSIFSRWTPEDFLTLIACALLEKKLNKGEGLNKRYFSFKEREDRHFNREEQLCEKWVDLNVSNIPKKFTFGDPVGQIHVRT